MDLKKHPNHQLYIRVLRQMTPEQRLLEAFELTELTRDLFKSGLKQSFPDLTEQELKNRYLERLAKCHNRNY
jgi:hypothetical protein